MVKPISSWKAPLILDDELRHLELSNLSLSIKFLEDFSGLLLEISYLLGLRLQDLAQVDDKTTYFRLYQTLADEVVHFAGQLRAVDALGR